MVVKGTSLMPPGTSLMPPTPTPHKNQALRNRDLFWDHPPNNSLKKKCVYFLGGKWHLGLGLHEKTQPLATVYHVTQVMITSLRELRMYVWTAPALLVMVIIMNYNPTISNIDPYFGSLFFLQLCQITSAGARQTDLHDDR